MKHFPHSLTQSFYTEIKVLLDPLKKVCKTAHGTLKQRRKYSPITKLCADITTTNTTTTAVRLTPCIFYNYSMHLSHGKSLLS